MPVRFGPDPLFPEAYENEGLMHYDAKITPRTLEAWKLPTFVMSTHDASVVSWRAMIPYTFFHQKAKAQSTESQLYVYQTMMALPSNWNTAFNGTRMTVRIEGAANMCGSNFDEAKEEQKYDRVVEYDLVMQDDLVFKDDSNGDDSNSTDSEDYDISIDYDIVFEDDSNATDKNESEILIS